ncbi:MAG: hypothetical protein EA416_07655 [Trueperaceae bacterium]|nr:MAG: hypothetical protein EA416_07655 [Trueperaceae bacterium]
MTTRRSAYGRRFDTSCSNTGTRSGIVGLLITDAYHGAMGHDPTPAAMRLERGTCEHGTGGKRSAVTASRWPT